MKVGSPVLVVSDKYSPDTEGGAEISLHCILRELHREKFNILVCALSHKVNKVVLTYVDGISVYRIPCPRTWPPQFDLPVGSILKTRKTILWNFYRIRRAISYIVSQKTRGILSRIRNLIDITYLIKMNHNMVFPVIDKDFLLMSQVVNYLKDIIVQIQPCLVHADNLFSILATNHACPTIVPLVGMIRDSRFFCMHKNQPVRVGNTICDMCSFDCLNHLPHYARNATLRLMKENEKSRREALNCLDGIVVTSEFLNKQISRLVPGKRIDVVPNPSGVDEQFCNFPGCQEDAGGPFIIAMVGMLNYNKGQLHLLEILPDLIKEIPDVVVAIAGKGNLKEELRKLAMHNGVEKHIRFMGFLEREEIFKLYIKSNVVICPSVYPEAFGRVPLEAGILRKPVVAYKVGGYKETILHNKTGILVDHCDKDGLRNAILRLYRSPELRRTLGGNARQRIQKHYSVKNASTGIIKVWKNTIKGKE